MLLKDRFDYPRIEQLYVSPMKRCLETATVLYPDMEYTIVTDLRECHFGAYEGKSVEQVLREDPNAARFFDNRQPYTPEGGESGQEFGMRALGALNDMLEDMMKNGIHDAAAITHGMLISLLLTITGYPKKDTLEWSSDSGCGFTVVTSQTMWMRDGAVEVVDIVPKGYLNGQEEE